MHKQCTCPQFKAAWGVTLDSQDIDELRYERCPYCLKEWPPFDPDRVQVVEDKVADSDMQALRDAQKDERVARLNEIYTELGDMANSYGGSDKGNAAGFLHGACTNIVKALKCIERGNPANDPIPIEFIASAVGGMDNLLRAIKPDK